MLIYRERQPPAPLRPFLECLWSVSDSQRREEREPERIVPDGCPELIAHLGDPFSRRVGRRFLRQPPLFLAGSLSRPWTLKPGPRVDTLGVRFRPGALTSLFPTRLSAATDREVPLQQLVGKDAASRLRHALASARTANNRFAALEAWLLEQATPVPRLSPAAPAVRLLLEARGQMRVSDLARHLSSTPRRLERAFARHLGLRPKLFARIVRLNAVLATLGEGEREAAVDLALGAGYFDQAHLLRDFRVLAGRTPRSGRLADGEMARHFTDPRRLRLLFAGE